MTAPGERVPRTVAGKAVEQAGRPRVLGAGRFSCRQSPGGELVVAVELDGGGGGEVRVPAALAGLLAAAAAGERLSLAAVARAMRGLSGG